MRFNPFYVHPTADRISYLLVLLLSCVFLCSTSWAQEEDPAEGSALDSIEDLVDGLEEESDLSDDDLSAAIQAEESMEADPEPEPNEPAEQTAADQAEAPAADTSAPAVKAKPATAQVKANALLVLKVDRAAKVWINGKYRGRVKPKKARPFPVRSGRVIVKLKDQQGNMRRFAKRVRPKSKVKASVGLSGKRVRTKGKRAGKKAVRKGAKRTAKKSAKKAAKKRVRKKAARQAGRKAVRKSVK